MSWTALAEASRGDSYAQVFADPRVGRTRLRRGSEGQRNDGHPALARPRRQLGHRPDRLDALRAVLRDRGGRRFAALHVRDALLPNERRRPLLGRAGDAVHRERAPDGRRRRCALRLQRLAHLSERDRRIDVGRRGRGPAGVSGAPVPADRPGRSLGVPGGDRRDRRRRLPVRRRLPQRQRRCDLVGAAVSRASTSRTSPSIRRTRRASTPAPVTSPASCRPAASTPAATAADFFGNLRLPTTGALDLAVSANGGLVHAATSAGRLRGAHSPDDALVPRALGGPPLNSSPRSPARAFRAAAKPAPAGRGRSPRPGSGRPPAARGSRWSSRTRRNPGRTGRAAAPCAPPRAPRPAPRLPARP